MANPSNFAHFIYGSQYSEILYGTAEENVLYGYAGDDAIYGSAGRDFLYGGDGADSLFGQDGNDYLDGGAGGDTLDGGAGLDSVNYHDSDAAVTINLQTQMASGGHADGDTLISIEYARGSHYDDTLIGNAGNNFLCGLGGDDAIYGMAGDDILRGAEHADYLDGGTGMDTATYWSSDAGVTVDLDAGTGQGGHAEGDILVSIEQVLGSEEHSDTLLAAQTGSRLYGYGGDDALTGRGGDDMLSGGVGNDTLLGSDGLDMLFGEAGEDTLDGGEGNDLLTAGTGNDIIAGGLGADQFKFRTGDGIDTLTDFEAGTDRIVFSDGQTTWQDLITVMDGDDAVIYYGDGDVLTVENATLSDVWGAFQFY